MAEEEEGGQGKAMEASPWPMERRRITGGGRITQRLTLPGASFSIPPLGMLNINLQSRCDHYHNYHSSHLDFLPSPYFTFSTPVSSSTNHETKTKQLEANEKISI